MTKLTWVADPSEPSLRSALAAVSGRLADRPLVVQPGITTSNPRWLSGTAVVDRRFVVKFAWSEPAAAAVYREGRLLRALRAVAPALPLPEVVAQSEEPVLLITRLVPGQPLTSEAAHRFSRAETAQAGDELGAFLAGFHAPAVLDGLREEGLPLANPEPQADTASLRARFVPLLEARQAEAVLEWCDWVDHVLAEPSRRQALVHGDFHGHNQVWDRTALRLQAVVDFEESGPADPHYDFRYLPAQGPVGLYQAVVRRYEAETGQTVDLPRVLAWHVRTVLGDALWRTEASVALPDGGTVTAWVDALALRLRRLGSDRCP